MKDNRTYKSKLAAGISGERITMGEGNTPLVPARNIGEKYGIPHLYFKLETTNPSGSYKDRFAAAAVSHLVNGGAGICMATSSGNTGSALAAYCARAGLPCFIIVVDGAPAAKLRQMQIYGAHTLMVRGFGLDTQITSAVFDHLTSLAGEFKSSIQISAYKYSPIGMQGVETIAFELAHQLPGPRLHVFSPAGGGGLNLAVGRGFLKWKEKFGDYHLPKLYCVQPEGNNTISGALIAGESLATPIRHSTTKISGLQVPNVIDGNQVIEVCQKLNGGGHLVSDEEIFRMQGELAKMEGIYCEPAGAVALAGAVRAKKMGLMNDKGRVVCLVTGHGFKDPPLAERIINGDDHFFESIEDVELYLNQNIRN